MVLVVTRARDMTRKQFLAAIKRRGWRQRLVWISGTDKEGRHCGVGMVMMKGRRGWKTNYRASLAKACRELQSEGG